MRLATPQSAILSAVIFNALIIPLLIPVALRGVRYRPLDRYEWEDYRSYQSTGRTYYGRDQAAGAPKYGTQGTATADRYSGSNYAKSGGFKDSKYASKSGNYRDSRFATPGASDPNGDHSPKRFGSGSSQPHFNPPSRPSAPRPSFRPPSSGRRFGRH